MFVVVRRLARTTRTTATTRSTERVTRAVAARDKDYRLYCSSLTFSIQSAHLPSSSSSMAMCVIAVVGAAPFQCFSSGASQTTSPGRISSIGPPQRCTLPQPAVTIRV